MKRVGDIIEVDMEGEWVERIYIMDGKQSGVIVVKLGDKQKYLNGEAFDTMWYAFDEWRPVMTRCGDACSCNSRKECKC